MVARLRWCSPQPLWVSISCELAQAPRVRHLRPHGNRRTGRSRGAQVHRCAGVTLDMTVSTCIPQPLQVVFPQRPQRAGLHMRFPLVGWDLLIDNDLASYPYGYCSECERRHFRSAHLGCACIPAGRPTDSSHMSPAGCWRASFCRGCCTACADGREQHGQLGHGSAGEHERIERCRRLALVISQ